MVPEGTPHANEEEDDEQTLVAYGGLESSLDDMETGVAIEELGLLVCLGPSLVADGRGLFISILDEVDEVTLPAGTAVCGYSKGSFRSTATSDKSVAFYFKSTEDGVMFEGKLVSLVDTVRLIEERLLAAGNTAIDLTNVVQGHILSYDPTSAHTIIEPDLDFKERIFVPSEADDAVDNPWGPGRLGMYANDLAFYDEVTEELYHSNSEELNTVQIVWRVVLSEGKLQPTWPVVVTKKDLLLTNREPTEVGLEYGWRYWKNTLELQQQQ